MKRCCKNCKHEYLPIGIEPCFSCIGRLGWPRFEEKEPPKPMTNADRIRMMTDEELAEWISQNVDCVCIANQFDKEINCGRNNETCAKAWLDWLKKERKNDEQRSNKEN